MTEKDWQRRITDLCDYLGLQWHHETDSRRSRKGFPDLVIAGPGGLLFAELKSEKGRIRPEQKVWLDVLTMARADVYLWRPSDWAVVQERLHRLAGR